MSSRRRQKRKIEALNLALIFAMSFCAFYGPNRPVFNCKINVRFSCDLKHTEPAQGFFDPLAGVVWAGIHPEFG